jgi:hypothetical protein
MMKSDKFIKTSFTIMYLILFLSVSYAQTKTTESTVPAWKVQVVDETGKPIANVLVRQIWQDYDVERKGHQEDVRSDENGYATFSQRRIPYNPGKKAKARAKQVARFGVHASLGLHAEIWAYGNDPHIWSFVDYKASEPLPEKIILKRMRVKIYP